MASRAYHGLTTVGDEVYSADLTKEGGFCCESKAVHAQLLQRILQDVGQAIVMLLIYTAQVLQVQLFIQHLFQERSA